MTPVKEPCLDPRVMTYSRLMAESYRRWTGIDLADARDVAQALYDAPFALVSHGTQEDPLFRYANRAAQALWGLDWTGFMGMASRLTAEPVAAQERQALLDEAARNGHVTNYRGVRRTADGRRFQISDTTLWNVTDDKGLLHGQAAAIARWEWLA